ncbi:hypothetical protein SteCoe_25696 [Stentor coeruleus]|uniref:Serine aminopeptidase S33 domain-containing protein n=1 Tax=Stentor coeruleus TaxID=5963 RepID=A0A1R2BEK5_9CILI|nr:hypothetical protein SteCoe_25696 [Stentor coeruleus]
MSYEDLWKAIIRPPRENYRILDLGDCEFQMGCKNCKRTDFTLTSVQGFRIVASHYEPIDSERISPILPCVIYLHGNSSCRLEALNSIYLLTGNITLVSIDFPGCGLSEGDYISLGWYEQYDLANLVDYLKEERRVGSIGIWGRSMGAATAILYASSNPKGIEALVLDSPYAKLKGVAMNLARAKAKYVPKFLLRIIFALIRSSIMKIANFDIKKLKPIKHVKKINIPAIIAYSTNDELVPCKQFEKIQVEYGGESHISIFRGEHNDMRPSEFCREVGRFFCRHLKVLDLKAAPILIPPHLVNEDVEERARTREELIIGQEHEQERSMTVSKAAADYYSIIPSKK